jgi:integrase
VPAPSDPTTRPKGNGWEARVHAGGKAYSAYGKTPAIALERLDAKLDLHSYPTQNQSQAHTLRSYTETAYLPTLQHKSQKWREQVTWATTQHIYPRFGELDLEQIHRADIQRWISKIPLSPSSVGHIRKVLGGILKLAVIDGLLPSNPVDHVETPRIRPPERQPLTVEEYWQLREHARGKAAEGILILGPLLGCTVSEALGIQAGDIARKGRFYRLRIRGTKTDSRDRLLPLPYIVHRSLRGITLAGDPSSQNRALKRICSTAGFRPISTHLLRHTYATWLQEIGCPDEVRRTLMGHKDRTVLGVYSHSDQEYILRAWLIRLASYVYGGSGIAFGIDWRPRSTHQRRKPRFQVQKGMRPGRDSNPRPTA